MSMTEHSFGSADAVPSRARADRTDRFPVTWMDAFIWLLGFGRPSSSASRAAASTPWSATRSGSSPGGSSSPASWSAPSPRRLGGAGWTGLALLTAFLAWTALSLACGPRAPRHQRRNRPARHLPRRLRACALDPRVGRRPMLVAAVGTGIAFIALIALLSRLHPAWFPSATETANLLKAPAPPLLSARLLERRRGLVAIGIPCWSSIWRRPERRSWCARWPPRPCRRCC